MKYASIAAIRGSDICLGNAGAGAESVGFCGILWVGGQGMVGGAWPVGCSGNNGVGTCGIFCEEAAAAGDCQ